MVIEQNLFDQRTVVDGSISMGQAAKEASVSPATIRNWVKTKYLVSSGKGMILRSSFDHFMANVAGKEKLNSRANKSRKENDKVRRTPMDRDCLFPEYSTDSLGTEYENSLPESYRNKEGIYYTPSRVVEDMLQGFTITNDTTFLDPCCGSGNFILHAIRLGVRPQNVYGYDTDENAVRITRQRIREEFGLEEPNIFVGDFMNESQTLRKNKVAYDLIFTNPPWGKKLPKPLKTHLAKCFDCGGSLDTTSLFMGSCLYLLNPNGILGFLVQEAFFNISAFEYIRNRTLSKRILRMVDYGKVFKGLLTRAQAIILKNEPSQEDVTVQCEFEKEEFARSQASFKDMPNRMFNFWASNEDSEVIDRLYSTKHITLKDKAKWALGIVTGNNEKYCRAQKEDDNYVPIYKGADIKKDCLREVNTYIKNDFSVFQQVAPIEMYNAPEKLIYRFISSDLCFFHDNQQRLVLNSANILIPEGIGITTKQLSELLNSEILNWLFKKMFRTHKILRGDLELLPIHTGYFDEYNVFSEETYLQYLNIKKVNDGTFRIKG